MFGQGFNYGFLGKPLCFTDTTDIFKDNSGVALYTLDYDGSDAGGATGKFGEGAVFNGSNSKITLPSSGTTPIDLSTENWTVSLWFKQNARATTTIFSKWGSGTANVAFIISVLSSDNTKLYIGQKSTSGATTSTIPSQSFDINVWNHLVVTRSSTQTIVYLNNIKEEFSTTNNVRQSPSTPFIIGAQYGTGSGTSFFNGSIDQVRLFNRTISTLEAATLYNETKNTTNTLQVLSDTSCIATYTFDGSSADLSGNYSGTDTNILYKYDGIPTNVDFGVGGKSLYGARFNGSSSTIDTGYTPPTGNNDFSVSCWINKTSSDIDGIWSTFTNSGTNRLGIGLQLQTNGQVTAIGFDSSGAGVIYSDTTVSSNQWYHLVLTYEGGLTKLYIDGVAQSQTINKSITSHYATLHLGNYYASLDNANMFKGSLDQVRIFSKALSSSEVSKLYGNGAGEIACAYASTTDNIGLPITNTAYYKLDNDSKDSARSTGKFNEGAVFNGNSSRIQISSTPTVPLDVSSGNFSISMWVNPPNLTNNNKLIYKWGTSAALRNWLATITTSGVLYVVEGTTAGDTLMLGTTAISTNVWTHIAITRTQGGDLVQYINGVATNTFSTQNRSLKTSTEPLYIGYQAGQTTNFTGSIDQVRLFNVALSSADVSNLYTETASDTNTLSFPSGQTAIATYQLDGNSTDLSGNYNGTDTNIAYAYDGTDTNVEYRFGRFGQAAVFNGSNYINTNLKGQRQGAVSLWFKRNGNPSGGEVLIASQIGSSSNRGIWLNIQTTGIIRGLVSRGTQGTHAATVNSTSTNAADGNWHHVVFSWDLGASGTNVFMYFDGQLENSVSASPSSWTTQNMTENYLLGRYATSTSNLSLNGSIDQVRIYSTVLDIDQVTELYNEKPEVDTSNFKAVLYDGNSSHNYISNVGFQPDLVWTKPRTNAGWHWVANSIVGGTLPMASNATNPSITRNDHIQSFDTNGFTLGPDGTSNGSGVPAVAWCWKGGGDAVAGSSSQATNVSYSANTEAGFSIVKFTSSTSTSQPPPMNYISHGLNSPVEMTIYKKTVDTQNWSVQHKDLDQAQAVYLNLSNAAGTPNPTYSFFDNTSQTGSIGVRSNFAITRGAPYIAYCFHSVAGYSKIGSYSGDGNPNHEITDVGFQPNFLLIKNTGNSATDWLMYDNKRGTTALAPNQDFAESTYGTSYEIEFISNGFKIIDSNNATNQSGTDNFIYMAFK